MERTVADTNKPSQVVELVDAAIVTAHSPDTVVIDGVNWSVSAEEFWVVGGSPGSGKSDLLATAAGLMRPLRGVHRLFGKELSGLEEEELIQHRLRVGIVFGNEGRLFNQLTVAENVALPLCYHRNCDLVDVRNRIDEILDATRLAPLAQRTPGNISRSMRPRIALARALALPPEILFLDNPLREIDPAQRRWWLDFLAALSAGHPILGNRALTLVVATDDFRAWTGAKEKFALITGNRWLEIGDRANLNASREPLLREMLSDEIATQQSASPIG